MNFVYLLATLCTLLALAARRWAWATAAGMVVGAVLVLAALVLNIPGESLLLCLLVPCAAALLPQKGGRP